LATVQSEVGRIKLFEDFTGPGIPVADTVAPPIMLGQFNVVGQGLAETDSGAPRLDSDALDGVIQLTTTDEDIHAAGLQTATMFDVAKMAPIVMEARVRCAAITTGEIFIGFSDVNTDLAIIEGAISHIGTTTVTLTASDLVGFQKSSEATDSTDWHGVFNGGTTTGATVSTDIDFDTPQVAGDFQILKLEIDPDGTARWYIDGVLKQTKVGAVSTTTDLCFNCLVESKTTAVKTMDVDYVLVTANRDWTI
jgi:hypothetical protein